MTISFITALIEFGIFLYLVNLFFYSRNKSVALASVMVFLLALYQLSEYMLCNTMFSELWARVGFAAYTFIPVVAFNIFIELSNKKTRKWIYIFPAFFAVVALLYPGFIIESTCKIAHVSVNSFVFRDNVVMLVAYLTFYSAFPILGIYIFIKSVPKIFKDSIKLRVAIIIFALSAMLGVLFFIIYNLHYSIIENSYSITGVLITAIGACLISVIAVFVIRSYETFLKLAMFMVILSFLLDFILYVVSVQFSYDFSSMWCHFAFLYSISCLMLAQIVVSVKKD